MEIIKKHTAFFLLLCIAVHGNYARNTSKVNTFHTLLMKDEKNALQTTIQHNQIAFAKGEMNTASFVIDLLTPAMGNTFKIMESNEMQQISTDVGTMYAANTNLIYVLIGKPYLPELNESKVDIEEKITQRAKEYGRQLGDKGALIYLSPVLTKDREWSMPAYVVTAINNEINNNGEIKEYLETGFNEITIANAKDVLTARAYVIMNMMQGGSNPNPEVIISSTSNTNYGFDTKNDEGYTYISVEKGKTTEVNVKIKSGDPNGNYYLEPSSNDIEILGGNQLTNNNGNIDQNITIKANTLGFKKINIWHKNPANNKKTKINKIGVLAYNLKAVSMPEKIINYTSFITIDASKLTNDINNIIKQGVVKIINTPIIETKAEGWDKNNNGHLDWFHIKENDSRTEISDFEKSNIIIFPGLIYNYCELKNSINKDDKAIIIKAENSNLAAQIYSDLYFDKKGCHKKTLFIGTINQEYSKMYPIDKDNINKILYSSSNYPSGYDKEVYIELENPIGQSFNKENYYVIWIYSGILEKEDIYIGVNKDASKQNLLVLLVHELLHLKIFGSLFDIDNEQNIMHYTKQTVEFTNIWYRLVNWYCYTGKQRQWEEMQKGNKK